ncbi:MAG: NfeD family protein [Dehalococcoidia bacterium]
MAISAIVVAMKKNYDYSLIGKEAKVVTKLGPMNEPQYMVKVRGELWSANSTDDLKAGDRVKVLSADELVLVVGKTDVE